MIDMGVGIGFLDNHDHPQLRLSPGSMPGYAPKKTIGPVAPVMAAPKKTIGPVAPPRAVM